MEVPREYERAVMAVMGERLGHVIVDDPESGRRAVDYLKKKTSGRGSFIPRTPRANGRSSLEGISGSGIIGSLTSVVSFSGDLNGLGDFLLGGALLVQDLEVALDLWSRNGFTATLVTLDGDVVDPAGIITGGNQDVEETPLARKRKLRELASECRKAEAMFSEERERRDRLRELLTTAENDLEALEEKYRQEERSRIGIESGLALSSGELANLEGALGDLDAEIGLGELEEKDLEASIEERMGSLEELKKEEAEREAKVVELEKRGKDLALRVEERRKALEESRLRVGTAHLKKMNSQRALEAARDRGKEFEDRRLRIQAEIQDARSRINSHQVEIENGRETVTKSVVLLEERKESLVSLRREQEVARKSGDELAMEARRLRTGLDGSREKSSAVDIRIHELRSENQHLQDRVAEEHGLEVGEITPDRFEPGEFDRDEAGERIELLKEKISRLGDVNPGAVEEFEELSERFAFLSAQKGDLEESVASLQQAIRKINRTSRERFLSTFREVSANFSELFPRLIEGGSAQMFLLDEADPLNTGVEIQVRLPGKRLKSMQLLSGGEKAMVSLTMILSMFLVKPSPVCILDEVDAPLDDENLGNFSQIVREMAERFQFLIITHNKLTMEAVDVLYGITMREPGVSQVVSVRLRDVA
jgi:chromosome segregation protein